VSEFPVIGPRPWMDVGVEITRVLRRVDPGQANRLRAKLENPRGRCFFTGQGRSGFVAQMAAMRLMHLGRGAHVVGEATAPAFSTEDTLVVVSGSGGTPTSVLRAQQAQDLGGAVCCLTATPGSPIALLSDPCLIVPSAGSMQFAQVLFSQVALLVLDGLALAISGGDTAISRRNHANLE
jgi:6-phospho-3-hexuloisomerase